MCDFNIDQPQSIILYSLKVAPPAMRKLETIPTLDCADLCRQLPELALQPVDVAADFEGGALHHWELRNDRNHLRYRVQYLIESSIRTVTVLDKVQRSGSAWCVSTRGSLSCSSER